MVGERHFTFQETPPVSNRRAVATDSTAFINQSNKSIFTTNTKSTTTTRRSSIRSEGEETHFSACIRLKYSHAIPHFKAIPQPTREKVLNHTSIGYGVLTHLARKIEDCQSFRSGISTVAPPPPPPPSKPEPTKVESVAGSRRKFSLPSTTTVSQLRSVHRPEPPQDPGSARPGKKDLASTWKDCPSVLFTVDSSDCVSFLGESSSPSTAFSLDSLSREEPRQTTIWESSDDNEEDSVSDDEASLDGQQVGPNRSPTYRPTEPSFAGTVFQFGTLQASHQAFHHYPLYGLFSKERQAEARGGSEGNQ
jgi:hypothetical protein